MVLTFAVLALLFGIFTPFMHEVPNRWCFFFGGLGYSAFLAFFVVGLSLLPNPTRPRVFMALLVVQVFGLLLLAAITCIAYFQPQPSLMSILIRPAVWVLYAFGAAMLGFACYGWYFRLALDAAKAT